MNRLSCLFLGSALVAILAGCTPADTAPPGDPGTPTPEPTPIYSNQTYAKALKTASYRLRGVPPLYADTQSVLAGGQPAYVALVDQYLDPAQNPALGPSVRAFYRTMFMMGTTIDGINYDEVPNLAAYAVLNDLPVTEILTAEYCVDNNFAMLPDCTDGAPAGQRAGVISNKAFLEKFGAACTVNMRRTSVVHQLFACGIYPDPDENPAPLSRTNTPEALWPINNSGTPDEPSDDFPDPGEGYNYINPGVDMIPGNGDDFPEPIADPAGPNPRLHKKYQSKLPSASGAKCHDCHGQLNARRPVFTPFDPDGVYLETRSMGLNIIPDDNVEAPAVNGDQDYCSAVTPADAADDMDNASAFDCQATNPPASYLGQPMTTLKDFGAHIINRDLNDRFYTCMATRHYNFVLGKSQGELSMQAAGGSGPPAMAPATLQKYSAVYEANGWNSRELFRTIFKSNEFLSSQGAPITP